MDTLQARAREMGVELDERQIGLFAVYLRELKDGNERANLTAIVDDEEIVAKHFLDSLTILPFIPPGARTMIDIGTGAGFPGLPVKIARPELVMTLLDATAKKVLFLEHLISLLELQDISALQGRAEDLGREARYREQFDAAAARAVAPLPVLAEFALPLVKTGGVFIAEKGGEEDIEASAEAIKTLGGTITRVESINIPGLPPEPRRRIIVIEKRSETPPKFPRRAGIPSKRPLQ